MPMCVGLPSHPYSFLIEKRGNIIVAQDSKGRIRFSGTDAASVIQYAWNQKGTCVIKSGTYNISRTLNAVADLEVILEPNAVLEVPNGFSGDVIKLTDGVHNFKIRGGSMQEAGATPQRLWTAFKLHSSSNVGIWFNTIEGMHILNPNVAIKLLVDNVNGWINDNTFSDLQIYYPNIFIDFDMPVTYSEPWGFNGNLFFDIKGQSGSNTTYGAKNIRHYHNIFIDVIFADLPSDAVSASIHSNACGTIIIGGSMVYQNFEDNGARTMIIDWRVNKLYSLQGKGTTTLDALSTNLIFPIGTTSSVRFEPQQSVNFTLDIKPYSDSMVHGINLYDKNENERLIIRKDRLTAYEIDVIRNTTIGSLRPLMFRLHDIPSGIITEMMRIDTDKNVKFFQGMKIPTSAPETPVAGCMYFDTSTNKLYVYNGTSWVSVTLA